MQKVTSLLLAIFILTGFCNAEPSSNLCLNAVYNPVWEDHYMPDISEYVPLTLNAEITEEIPEKTYTEEDLELLARLIYCEMGCSWIPDEEQRKVGSVVLNRVASELFPDTIREVIYQPGQYAPAITGWIEMVEPDEKALENARWVLENGSILPEEVVFQSTSIQGEIHSSYYDQVLGTTTYYCMEGK